MQETQLDQINWNEALTLKHAQSQIFLVSTKKHKTLLQCSENNAHAYFTQVFKKWSAAHRAGAKKAFFDYSSQERAMYWTWLLISLFLIGGLASVFLIDAFHTVQCNHAFKQGAQLSQNVQISKIKKDRRGNYIWTIEFITKNAEHISGKRAALLYDENGKPLTQNTSVVYAEQNPECWDISLKPNEIALPNAQRWFTLNHTLGFGCFFAALSLLLSLISIKRLLQKKPHREVIEKVLFENL